MSKKIIFIVVIALIIVVGIWWFVGSGSSKNLINPSLDSKSYETSTPIPTPNTPKTFKFDSSTDLKAELDSINPQVLDSDFE